MFPVYNHLGDHETQESEGGEADLHKYYVSCKKNPGHRQFIPVDTFTLKHLPEGLQDYDLYEYIKAIAGLTVRVSVAMSSPHRPNLWPNTTTPYPFYNMTNRKNLRTGSGWVWNVHAFQDGVRQDGAIGCTRYLKCICRKCEDSGSQSNVWWEFSVSTATHVVFDDNEASHTALRLFYDRDYCPVVCVDKVKEVDADIENDFSCLKCVTCDKNVGNKLMAMWKQHENIWEKVKNKYFNSNVTVNHNFNFIVSHPHGCSKLISVGQWKDKYKVDEYRTKFTYTTCTCPGSSGAYVYCVGYGDWWAELVHSGTLSGLNYSGISFDY